MLTVIIVEGFVSQCLTGVVILLLNRSAYHHGLLTSVTANWSLADAGAWSASLLRI